MDECAAATETDVVIKRLRQELKEWEQSFAAAHQGHKAGRDDIKRHPDIVHKYKQYERLRRPASKRTVLHNANPSKTRSTTDPYPIPASHSPYKRPKHAHPAHPPASHSHHSPSPRHLSPRALRTSIGPTPQRDGQVLGLFDQLSASSKSQTPFKRKALHSIETNVQATPSKRPDSKDRTDAGKKRQMPLKGSNSKLFNDLLTPSTRRARSISTPTSSDTVSKLRFDDTPAFLRRDSQHADLAKGNVLRDEERLSWSPVAVRKLPKAAGRSLSALVRGLREMEDEDLDEELNVLREMESESAHRNHCDQPKVFVSESQRLDMPLGPDRSLESGEDGVGCSDDGKGKDGKSLKAWKKKGQKRTTRRSSMKPNTTKWKPEPAWKVDKANEDEENGLAETQTLNADRPTDCGCDSDEYEDTGGSRGAVAGNGSDHVFKNDLKNRKKLAKVEKKISATAHANFRALKIKNKQSKTKKGSRFGRKR